MEIYSPVIMVYVKRMILCFWEIRDSKKLGVKEWQDKKLGGLLPPMMPPRNAPASNSYLIY